MGTVRTGEQMKQAGVDANDAWSRLKDEVKMDDSAGEINSHNMQKDEQLVGVQSELVNNIQASKIEHQPIKLTDKEYRKLDGGIQRLYDIAPKLFAQLQDLKQRRPDLSLNPMMLEAGFYAEAYSDNGMHREPVELQRSDESLEMLGEIYDTFGDDGFMLRNSDIFVRSENEIDEIKHSFDIAKNELGLMPKQEIMQRPQSLIRSFLTKALGQKRKNNSGKQDNYDKNLFLLALVNTYKPARYNNDDGLRDLAKMYRESVEDDDRTMSDFITSLMGDLNCSDLCNAASMNREIMRSDYSSRIKGYQVRSLGNFAEICGFGKEANAKFMSEILPLLDEDEKTVALRAQLISAVRYNKTTQKEALDFAIQEILPGLYAENPEIDSIKNRLYTQVIEVDTDYETRKDVLADVNEKILPFALQQKSDAIGSGIIRDLAWTLVREDFQQYKRLDHEEWLGDTIQKLGTQLIPFLERTQKLHFSEKTKIVKMAMTEGMPDDLMDYLWNDFAPMVEQDDARLGSLLRNTDLRGEEKYREYDFDCLMSRVTPLNLNRLLLSRRELPFSDANRLEQNRVDALAIEGVLVPDHGFIHDEDPKAHDLLAAMLNYYEARETGGMEDAKMHLMSIIGEVRGRFGDLTRMVFDLENYEKVIRGEVWDDNAASRTYNIPAIEVLRRLVDNTDINLVKAPEVDDFVWRELMEEVGLRRNPENGSMRADWQSVTNLVTYTNAWIIEHQGKYGLDPVRVEAITFAERAATYALRNVTERERLELPYDEGFKEIVKFQELTGSGDSKFNLEEFEIFWSRFQNVRMDNLDDLKAHYWRLFEREADKLGRLERIYQDEGRKDSGMLLQSGNLFHELTLLLEPRNENTLRGRIDGEIRHPAH